MEPIRVSTTEFFSYVTIIGAAIGLVLGLIPLGFGFIRNRRRLGIIGIIASTLGGAIAGVILSVPAMALFTWLVVRRSDADAAADHDLPAEDI